MRGKVLQRNVLPLFVLHTRILCPVVILSSCRLPILFCTHYWGQIIINYTVRMFQFLQVILRD